MSLPFTQSDFFLRKVHPLLSKIPLYDYWLLRRKSYLKSRGWFASFKKGKSIDQNHQPIPWFTYGALELLNDRLPSDFSVFEYGCGLGTRWWAERSDRVDAVEHNLVWFNRIVKNMPKHVTITHKNLEKGYETAIYDSGQFYDVVIVDGRHRVECAKNVVSALSERGIVIFDDTNRDKYREGIEFLKESGFRQLPFRGFSPIEFMECETSIFYRDKNLLEI